MFTLSIDGTEIAVHETGCGEPVILLHCSAGNGRQYGRLAETLQAGSGVGAMRFLMPDLHGYGASDTRVNPVPLSLNHEAAIVTAIAHRLGRPVHVIGHSYGGAVALAAAAIHAPVIRSLVLIEPVSIHLLLDGDSRDDLLVQELRRVASAVRCGVMSGDPAGGMATFIDFWGGEGTWDRMSAPTRDAATRHAPQVVRNFWSGFSHSLRLVDLRRLAVPTRLIFGEHTKPITRRVADLLERTLPDVSLRMVPGAGHMAPLTHPKAVAAQAGAHLALTCPHPIGSAA